MTTLEQRGLPPYESDERTNLTAWLDFYRATLAAKCSGLAEDGLGRQASLPPSTLTLLGVLRHLAEVERTWFRRVLSQEEAEPVFACDAETVPRERGFRYPEEATFAEAFAAWEAEVAVARERAAARSLEDTGVWRDGSKVSLRWILTHMIGEYARHCGHADLLRERADGSVGF